jgi:Na+:H+ antiporter
MTEDRGDLVGRIPLFTGLSAEQRAALGKLFFSIERDDGDTIVSEGDDGVANFYVITGGEAVVTSGGREINRLGPGDYFGEMALVRGGARSATVRAVGHLEMLAISGWNFAEFLSADAAIGDAIKQAIVDNIEADALRSAEH